MPVARKRKRSQLLWSKGHRRCHYCNRRLAKFGENGITADHKDPLSRGGYDSLKT